MDRTGKSLGLGFACLLAILSWQATGQESAPTDEGTQEPPATSENPAVEDPGATKESTVPQVEEIVVTAQRKKERLQDVPIAISVLTADSIKSMGVADTRDLQVAVPGLAYTASGVGHTPFLRGVGSNSANPNVEPSVATYIDGIYVAAPFALVTDLANVERVEVLKGPQGTLFGRNATGGVIQIVTRDPRHDPRFEVRGGVANYRTYDGSVYATSGLTDDLAVDVLVHGQRQDDGWGRNVALDREIYEGKNFSMRSKALYTPTAALSFRLAADYAESNSTMNNYRLPGDVIGINGEPSPSGTYDTNGDITLDGLGVSRAILRQSGVSLRADYQMADLQFVSLTSYRRANGENEAEVDTTPDPWVEARLPMRQKNVSQEFQVLSARDRGFDWVVGAYLYGSNAAYADGVFNGLAFSNPPGSEVGRFEFTGEQRTRSYAAYAQGTTDIAEGTRLTTGLRFTHERQERLMSIFDVEVPKPRDRKFNKPTWRIALDHALTGDVSAYVSYNRGIKGGGFDLISATSNGYDPEVLDAYEVGLKSEWLNRRLRLNASTFFYDYQDIQVQVVPAGEEGGLARTTNAAKAELKGLDLDLQYMLLTNLKLAAGFSILDGEYKKFRNTVSFNASPLDGPSSLIDASGNETIQTPKFAGTLSGEYRVQSAMGEFPVSVMVSHNDGYFFSADNRLKQKPFTLVNASVGWNSRDSRYGVTAWIRNLTDEDYYAQGLSTGFGDIVTLAAPRTFGLTTRFSF